MTDPWLSSTETGNSKESSENITAFEDNFIKTTKRNSSENIAHSSLPDSKQYLETLERKLNKIKGDSNIIKQLSKKREECLRNLLNDSLKFDRENDLVLDTPLSTNDSTVHEIYRHICPVQALNIGETVHIVKYDQLDGERLADEKNSLETTPEGQ